MLQGEVCGVDCLLPEGGIGLGLSGGDGCGPGEEGGSRELSVVNELHGLQLREELLHRYLEPRLELLIGSIYGNLGVDGENLGVVLGDFVLSTLESC